MQGDACCVLFELFAFDRGQAGQNPNPSQTALRSSRQGGFGTRTGWGSFALTRGAELFALPSGQPETHSCESLSHPPSSISK
jgi:hypothetical protein